MAGPHLAGRDGGEEAPAGVGGDRPLQRQAGGTHHPGVGMEGGGVVTELRGGITQDPGGLQRLVEVVVTQVPGREGVAAPFPGEQRVGLVPGDEASQQSLGDRPPVEGGQVGREGVVGDFPSLGHREPQA